MPTTVAAQVAALAVLLERIDKRAEEDRQERKAEQAKTELARFATSAELTNMRHSHDDIHRRLDAIEPVTSFVQSARAKAAGATIILGFIGSIVLLGWGLIKGEVQSALGW